MATRLDVMNKNIFRAFKRLLIANFNAFAHKRKSTGKGSDFPLLVSKYTAYIIERNHLERGSTHRLNTEVLESYTKVLVNYSQLKKQKQSVYDSSIIDEVSSVLYSYSHKKFYNFIKKPEVGFLTRTTICTMGIDDFVRYFTDSNTEKYVIRVKELVGSQI